MTDFLQIEDTPEFANFEAEREERTTGVRPGALWSWSGRGGFSHGLPASGWGPDPAPSTVPAVATPEPDDMWDSKTPLLSEAQWAHLCAELGIDPSFNF